MSVLAVLRRNPVALGLAVLLHLVLAVFLIFEIDWRDEVKPIGADVVVVQAELIDQQKLDAEVEKLKREEQQKVEEAAAAKRAEQAELEALQKRRDEEKRKLAELEKQRKQRQQDEARKAAEEKQRAAEEQARAAEIERKQEELRKQQEAEKKRIADLEKKRKAEEQKRQQEQAAREKAEREAKEKAEEAARKKAEEERLAKEKAEKERLAKEKAEKERLAKEKAEKERADRERANREAELAAQMDANELSQVMGAIRSRVERNWLRPPGTGEQGLRCTVRVRLGSSGSVLLVSVVKSSGNGAFDRSVEAAVRKADPLPMPRSERLLAKFREIDFVFEPSN